MDTVFVINPKAGTGRRILALKEEICSVATRHKGKIEIYETCAPRDGERFVRETCERRKGESIRFIACGGDGTFSEVVNGAIGYENVTVGVMPLGTGNDFCRNFPKETPFSDIEAQLSGETRSCDAISYTGVIDGVCSTRYSVNMFNIGFDCNVAAEAARLKKIPLIKGKLAYLLAIFSILVKKEGATLQIAVNGETVHQGPLLLTSIANGSYCGGGICSNPNANLQDGMMDMNIIYDVSRFEFLKKLPYYAKGTHQSAPGIDKILCEKRGTLAVITPLKGKMLLCADGEIMETEEVHFSAVKNAFSFSLPMKKNLNILEEKSKIKIG